MNPISISFISLFLLTTISSSAAINSADKPVDKPKVLIEEAKLSDDQKRILVPARVEAKIQSTLTADIEGHVTQILKPLGSVVKAGEIILFLENKDPGFTYAKVPVRSPMTGVLSQLMTSQMSKVSRGDKLFTIINPKSLRISTEFSSLDASLIKPGTKGVFKINSTINNVRVVGVSPLIDSRTGTASAELEFMSPHLDLPSIGSIGQIYFELSQGQIMLLPENSLFYQEGRPLIRVLKADNLVEKKPVELGEQRENLFVIKSGLKAGDKVIVRSSRPIKEGEAIEIEKPQIPSTESN